MDEKTRTDVIEKIVEAPKKTVYIDEFVEIEKNSKILEENENMEYNLNKTSKRKDITENIYDETDERLQIVNKNKKTIDSRKVSWQDNSNSNHHTNEQTNLISHLFYSLRMESTKRGKAHTLKCASVRSVLVGK